MIVTRRVAIIGGGASAILLLAHLARRSDCRQFSIDIYDRAGAFGRGVAYGTDGKSHLLNVRAGNMSALAHEPSDFLAYAAPLGYTPSDFVPRRIYADYLKTKIAQAQEKISVRFIQEDVLFCRKTEGGYVLKTPVSEITYDIAVQATGNVSPLRPAVKPGAARYHDSPWIVNYAALSAVKHIILLGSGLSAVDVVSSLYHAGYTGKISVMSRHGLFPAVHVMPEIYPSFIDGAAYPDPLELLRLLKHHVREAGVPWQAVVDSIRPHTNDIWRSWDNAQRDIFMKRLLTFWNVHRHRMAPEVANILKTFDIEMIHDRAMTVDTDGAVIGGHGTYQSDAVINCLGYRYTETGRIFDTPFKIGPARFGELFETTAIPEIRAQADEMARVI
jgi:uncharacterized NAD(P)/FAD-binding protein YdhS